MVSAGNTARGVVIAVLALAAATARADDDCDAPVASWQPRSAVQELAQRNSWQIHHLKIDDGCYEIKGLDADGNRFKAKLDPATLEIVSMKRAQERHRERLHDESRSEPRD